MEIKIGENIKYLREQKKMDQQELASKLNIPRSTLACWENGLRTPKLEQIVKIADFFNKNLDIIYEDLRANTSYTPTEEDLKKVLEEKGLLDKNGNLDKEKIDKVNKIYEVITNKEEN